MGVCDYMHMCERPRVDACIGKRRKAVRGTKLENSGMRLSYKHAKPEALFKKMNASGISGHRALRDVAQVQLGTLSFDGRNSVNNTNSPDTGI